jgi:hypothetical protein
VFSSCFALRKKTESQAHLTDTPRKAPTKKNNKKTRHRKSKYCTQQLGSEEVK